MEIISGIYCITNKVNGKQYIGLSKNCYKRWWDHREAAKRPKKPYQHRVPIYKAMRKYGLENFIFEIIEECSPEELKKREIYWISELDTYHSGYNATLGGDLPEGHTLKGDSHGMSKLSQSDVEECRILYREGHRSRDVWESSYKDKVKYSGFQRMWFGKTWKHIMPEVFQINPHPRSHITDEDIANIRELAKSETAWQIYNNYYKGKVGYASIWDIIHYKNRFDK